MIGIWGAVKAWALAAVAGAVALWLAIRAHGERVRAQALADDLARARKQRDAIGAAADKQIVDQLDGAIDEIKAQTEERLEEPPTPAAAGASANRRAALLDRLRDEGDDA